MLLALLSLLAHADEGMWMPEQLPELATELKDAGVALPSTALADPLGDPLGAIVSLGGCTASFVSADGLIVTNHHCAERYLQVNSDAEHDLAHDGYSAATLEDELPAGAAARVRIVERIDDVTSLVLGNVRRRGPDAARADAIANAKKALVAGCEADDPGLRCTVATYYGGLQYRLFAMRELRDVRLVYAPPASVGNYGDEIDNWMWPRHAGDFSFLRAYAAPDNTPAAYADGNVPYKPRHHLKVGAAGISDGDAVLVAGFPGSTERHAPLWQIEQLVTVEYPAQIATATAMVDALRALAGERPDLAPRLTATIGYLSNGLKYRQGIVDTFEASGALRAKRVADAELAAWVAADPKRKRTYGDAIDELRALDAEAARTWKRDEIAARLPRYVDLLGVARSAYRFAQEADKPDAERDAGYQDRDRADALARAEQLGDTMVLEGDRAIAAILLREHAALPADQQLAPVRDAVAAAGGDDALLASLFDGTTLTDAAARRGLYDLDVDGLRDLDDPIVRLAIAMEDQVYTPERQDKKARAGARSRLEPLYMEALLALHDGRVYPDANGSLRVTYGTVMGSSPRDGLWNLPFTTVDGMVAKAGPWPFDAPQTLLDAAPTAPQSPYAAAALGDVPVDFLSTVDTTGGNSGSPTLNADGELVGLLFDGTYESIIADQVFLPEITRSIHVDIRYVLWVLDTYGADRVLAELLPE